MDELRQQHLDFIKANPFEFAVNRQDFSEEEIALIEKYGNWFYALEKKQLDPLTDKQTLFVEEMKSRKPITDCMPEVQLWKRYRRQEIKEKDTRGVMEAPPPQAEDDPFYSRDGAKELRKVQFKTISEQHNK